MHQENMMSAKRPAIVAGLLMSGLIASPNALARPGAEPPAPRRMDPLRVAQADGDFIIRAAAAAIPPRRPALPLGATVQIDKELLAVRTAPAKEISR